MTAFVSFLEHTRLSCPWGELEYQWADADSIHFQHLGENRRSICLSQAELQTMLRQPSTRIITSAPKLNGDQYRANRTFASLPAKEREAASERYRYVLAYEEHFLNLRMRRTDAAIETAMPSIIATAHSMNSKHAGQRKPRAGNAVVSRVPPSPRTLRKWYGLFSAAGRDPRALIVQNIRTSARVAYEPEVEAIISSMVNNYLTLKRPSMRATILAALSRMKEFNEQRIAIGDLPVSTPCETTLRRRITALEPFTVHARRYGLDAARRKFSIFEGGLPEFRPGHRVEIDEWTIDVYSLFAHAGLLSTLSPKQRAAIPKGRRHIFVAIDCATRVVLGLKLASSPSSQASVALLGQICTDKSDISAACECDNAWDQHTGVGDISTDQGPPFACDAFRHAVVDLGWNAGTPPAAMPALRSTIERLFRTFGTELMPYLAGRIFGLREEQSDYASSEMTVLTDDDLERIFVKFIVDVYHVKSHEGLLSSPSQAWKEMVGAHGILSAPDALTQCVALGTEISRKNDRGGVTIFGLRYVSPYLQQSAVKGYAEALIRVRYSSREVAWVAIFNGEDWEPAFCTDSRTAGFTLSQWQTAVAGIRQRFRTQDRLTAVQIDAALQAITRVVHDAKARVGLVENEVRVDQVGLAEDSQFWAVSIARGNPARQPGPSDGRNFLAGHALPEQEATIATERGVPLRWSIAEEGDE